MPITREKRVEVWNTFFKMSRDPAIRIKKMLEPDCIIKEYPFSGGTLNEEQSLSLQLVSWTLLALQSREAHLVEELKENNCLSESEANAARYLGLKELWALLPKLASIKVNINFTKPPHQSIAELDSLRNHLFHVNYDKLIRNLPSIRKSLALYNNFVIAMEEMNVILKRHKKPHKRVLAFQV